MLVKYPLITTYLGILYQIRVFVEFLYSICFAFFTSASNYVKIIFNGLLHEIKGKKGKAKKMCIYVEKNTNDGRKPILF